MIVKKLELKILFFMFLFGTSMYAMEPNTGDIDQPMPLSTRSIYSQRSLKYLLVYLIKDWDCFKGLTDDQIIEKLNKLPKEFIESFELVSVLEKCYTNDEKRLLLACMLHEFDDLSQDLKATKPGILHKIVMLKHDRLLILVVKREDMKVVYNDFLDEARKKTLQELNLPHPSASLLSFAIMSNHLPTINVLLDLRIDINEQLSEFTPLSIAIVGKNVELARLLLEYGANPNIKLAMQVTSLHLAAQYNYPEIALLLLEYGADVNCKAVGNGNVTPLSQAVICGSYSVVSILVNEQAIQIDECDNSEQATPLLMCMKRYFYRDQLEQLAEYNQNNFDFSIPTLERMIVSFLVHKANINAQDINGFTTLMYASLFGFKSIARLLLSNGADAQLTNNAGETALSIAEENAHTQIIALLQPKPAATSSCIMQ